MWIWAVATILTQTVEAAEFRVRLWPDSEAEDNLNDGLPVTESESPELQVQDSSSVDRITIVTQLRVRRARAKSEMNIARLLLFTGSWLSSVLVTVTVTVSSGNVLGTPEFIYEFMKHMNSYIKKSYEFIVYMDSYMNSYIWIHIHMNSYNHYMNSYMKWLYEFIYIWIHIWNEYMNSWVYEFMYMNSNVWILNSYMNS